MYLNTIQTCVIFNGNTWHVFSLMVTDDLYCSLYMCVMVSILIVIVSQPLITDGSGQITAHLDWLVQDIIWRLCTFQEYLKVSETSAHLPLIYHSQIYKSNIF